MSSLRWTAALAPAFLSLLPALAACSGDYRFRFIDEGDRPVTEGAFPPPVDFRECREPAHKVPRFFGSQTLLLKASARDDKR